MSVLSERLGKINQCGILATHRCYNKCDISSDARGAILARAEFSAIPDHSTIYPDISPVRSRGNFGFLFPLPAVMNHNSGTEYYTPLRTEDPERRVTRSSRHGPEECFRIGSIPYGGSLDFSSAGSNSGSSSQDTYTYTYRYGPPGVAGLLRNRYTFACALFASIGGLTFGYDQGVIANVLVMRDFLERWPGVGPWEKGVMSTWHHIFRLCLQKKHVLTG